jgi:hypothetical protein
MLQTGDQLGKRLLERKSSLTDEKPVDLLTTDLEDLSHYVSDLLAAIPNPVYVVNPLGVIIDGN